MDPTGLEKQSFFLLTPKHLSAKDKYNLSGKERKNVFQEIGARKQVDLCILISGKINLTQIIFRRDTYQGNVPSGGNYNSKYICTQYRLFQFHDANT